MINELAGRRLWPDGGAVGRALTYGTRTFTVVGVTRDIYYTARDTIRPMLHIPAGVARRFPAPVVRPDSRVAAERLTSLVSRLDPQAIVYAKSLSEPIAAQLGDEQMGAQAAWAGGL